MEIKYFIEGVEVLAEKAMHDPKKRKLSDKEIEEIEAAKEVITDVIL